jgi:hypothetical protein
MIRPVDASRPNVVYTKVWNCFGEVEQGELSLPFYACVDLREHPGRMRGAFTGDVDEGEWRVGVEGGKGFGGGEGIVVGDLEVFPRLRVNADCMTKLLQKT